MIHSVKTTLEDVQKQVEIWEMTGIRRESIPESLEDAALNFLKKSFKILLTESIDRKRILYYSK